MRPKRNPELERRLYDWIMSESREGKKIPVQYFRRKALEMNRDVNFKASAGWAREYVKRWGVQDLIINLRL